MLRQIQEVALKYYPVLHVKEHAELPVFMGVLDVERVVPIPAKTHVREIVFIHAMEVVQPIAMEIVWVVVRVIALVVVAPVQVALVLVQVVQVHAQDVMEPVVALAEEPAPVPVQEVVMVGDNLPIYGYRKRFK